VDRRSKYLLLFLASALIAGCVTSTKTADHHFPETGKTVYVSHHYKGIEARYIGKVLKIIEKYDFEITRYDPYASYDLGFMISGRSVEITLKQGRDTVVQVRVHESEWAPEPVTPMSVLVNSAVDKFDETLALMISD